MSGIHWSVMRLRLIELTLLAEFSLAGFALAQETAPAAPLLLPPVASASVPTTSDAPLYFPVLLSSRVELVERSQAVVPRTRSAGEADLNEAAAIGTTGEVCLIDSERLDVSPPC